MGSWKLNQEPKRSWCEVPDEEYAEHLAVVAKSLYALACQLKPSRASSSTGPGNSKTNGELNR